MATRIKLAEQAQLRINNGFVDNAMQLQELMAYANTARDANCYESYFSLKQEGETMVSDSYIFDYEDQAVVLDTRKNLYYSVIPVNYIDLPKNRGIWQVSFMQDQFNTFVPVENGFLSMTRGTEAAGLQGRIGYWIEKDRIYYIGTRIKADVQVLMKIVTSGADLADDDVNFCTGEEEEKIILKMLQLYMGERVDQVNKLND